MKDNTGFMQKRGQDSCIEKLTSTTSPLTRGGD